ncbi:MAG: hypothetical protein LUG21_05810 [Clostridiales bacterium]|nr:hypothetical protein [Clostridiales bacterium]
MDAEEYAIRYEPVQTRYDGYYFRSRTEAKWAVFFKTAGISYEYEKERFPSYNHKGYLPDFCIQNVVFNNEIIPELYIEVKGRMDEDSAKRIWCFVDEAKSLNEYDKDEEDPSGRIGELNSHPLLVVGDIPNVDELNKEDWKKIPDDWNSEFLYPNKYNAVTIDNTDFSVFPAVNNNHQLVIEKLTDDPDSFLNKPKTKEAYEAARMERFEDPVKYCCPCRKDKKTLWIYGNEYIDKDNFVNKFSWSIRVITKNEFVKFGPSNNMPIKDKEYIIDEEKGLKRNKLAWNVFKDKIKDLEYISNFY